MGNKKKEADYQIPFTGSPVHNPAPSLATCSRCGGLLVAQLCVDLMGCEAKLDSDSRRCVQCGDITDLVILRNRELRPNDTYTSFDPSGVLTTLSPSPCRGTSIEPVAWHNN